MNEIQEIEQTRNRAIYWERDCGNCGFQTTFAMPGAVELQFLTTLEVGETKRVDPIRCANCAVLLERIIAKSETGKIVCAFPANRYVKVDIKEDFYFPLVGQFPAMQGK